MRDDPEWPQSPQKSENLNYGQVNIRQGHIQDRCRDNKAIELIPCFSDVAAFIHRKSQSYHFRNQFKQKANVHKNVQIVRNLPRQRIRRKPCHVGVSSQLNRRECDQEHDRIVKQLMLVDLVSKEPDWILLVKYVHRVFAEDPLIE